MSKTTLTKRFNTYLDNLIASNNLKQIAVAVSGGRDSMALTHLCKQWCQTNQIKLITLTVDHQLRRASKTEAQTVNQWMQDQNIEHHILTWRGKKPKTGIQEKARQARYQLLLKKCYALGVQHLFIGHHKEDQAETIIMRLEHGSDIAGLIGIKPISKRGDIRIIRPLLKFTRQEITDYCQKSHIDYIDDPSNEKTEYKRISWRKQIASLPDKQKFIDGLTLSSQRISRANDALEYYSNISHKNCVEYAPEGYANLNLSKIIEYPDAIALKVLRRMIDFVGGCSKPVKLLQIEQLYDLLKQPSSFEGATLGGCITEWHAKHPQYQLLFIREERNLPREITIKKENLLWDDRFLINVPATIYQNIEYDVTVSALGTNGLVQIKDILANNRRKINKTILKTMPCIKLKERILAVPLLDFFDSGYFVDIQKITAKLHFEL